MWLLRRIDSSERTISKHTFCTCDLAFKIHVLTSLLVRFHQISILFVVKIRLEDVDRSAKHQLEEYLSAARRAQQESIFSFVLQFYMNSRIYFFSNINVSFVINIGEHKVKLEQDKVASCQRRIADLEQDLQLQRTYFTSDILRFQTFFIEFEAELFSFRLKIGKRYLDLEQELESFRRDARNQGLSSLQTDLRLRDFKVSIFTFIE